ncbi:hypothetical protein ABVV53_10015 [Novosphingobium sp. RD2P27]|uniref:Uncharacterized protein n=1 Tax=Novosphingobium kalidii TaxID=3230299 RepID=A0ABV2D1S0_9SPHN
MTIRAAAFLDDLVLAALIALDTGSFPKALARYITTLANASQLN